MAADCKSVALAASKVRVLPSPPTFASAGGRTGVESDGRKHGRERDAREREGGSNSVVESQPSKLLVAGSIPVSRSNLRSHAHRVREPRLAGQAKVVRPDLSAEAASQRRRERRRADVAQLAERVLGKDEVTSSILVIGSNLRPRRHARGRRLASQLTGGGCLPEREARRWQRDKQKKRT